MRSSSSLTDREIADDMLEAGIWLFLRGGPPTTPWHSLPLAIRTITELGASHKRVAVCTDDRDADDLLHELNVLTRCDCTTRNERKAKQLSKRMDDLEERIDALAEEEELARIRPELDGQAVMDHLGIEPGRDVVDALRYLLENRLDEGVIGEDAARDRLDAWWADRHG